MEKPSIRGLKEAVTQAIIKNVESKLNDKGISDKKQAIVLETLEEAVWTLLDNLPEAVFQIEEISSEEDFEQILYKIADEIKDDLSDIMYEVEEGLQRGD